jgi:hypothetical protein
MVGVLFFVLLGFVGNLRLDGGSGFLLFLKQLGMVTLPLFVSLTGGG